VRVEDPDFQSQVRRIPQADLAIRGPQRQPATVSREAGGRVDVVCSGKEAFSVHVFVFQTLTSRSPPPPSEASRRESGLKKMRFIFRPCALHDLTIFHVAASISNPALGVSRRKIAPVGTEGAGFDLLVMSSQRRNSLAREGIEYRDCGPLAG